ncbi:MAG: hypothetical protein REJ50_17680, partial [Bordetella sp.]|nr:hypothetical protein [Bordetella sp.]
MKRLLSLSVLSVLLAACTTTQEIPPDEQPGGITPPPAEGPLTVPSVSALPDTPARALAGRYQRVNYSELPGWDSDDLSRLWPLVIRNCKGLM